MIQLCPLHYFLEVFKFGEQIAMLHLLVLTIKCLVHSPFKNECEKKLSFNMFAFYLLVYSPMVKYEFDYL